MTLATRVSSCLDCQTPIIGDRPFCAACQTKHGDDFIAGEVVDDAVTLPRPRAPKPPSVWQAVGAWILILHMFCVVVILLIFARRGC